MDVQQQQCPAGYSFDDSDVHNPSNATDSLESLLVTCFASTI